MRRATDGHLEYGIAACLGAAVFLLLIILVLVGWSTIAWAEYRKTPGTRFDVTEFHSEVVKSGVNMEGASCQNDFGTIVCEKMVGDFTEGEKAAIDAALAVHDPDAKVKREAKRKAARTSGDSKLKALGLTDEEIEARR